MEYQEFRRRQLEQAARMLAVGEVAVGVNPHQLQLFETTERLAKIIPFPELLDYDPKIA